MIKHKFAKIAPFLLFLALFSSFLHAEDAPLLISSNSVLISDKFHSADEAYTKRRDPSQAKTSLSLYEEILRLEASNVEALWKASRILWWIADQAEKKKEKRKIFQKAVDYAKGAIELNPDSVEGHFWLAANLGSYGEARGVLKSLFLVKPIRKELKEVLRLNDQYLGGAAYRILGIVDTKVPRIAGGSKKRALGQLEKAFSIGPKNPFNIFYLAEFYSIRKKKEQALEYLDILLTLEGASVDEADFWLMQKKGAALKAKLR